MTIWSYNKNMSCELFRYTSITPVWSDVLSNQVFSAILLITITYKIFAQSYHEPITTNAAVDTDDAESESNK